MTHSQRVLFLYSSPAGGHKECADAVRSAFQQLPAPHVKTIGLDAIHYLYPFLGSLVSKTYLEILKHTPQIWDFLYDNPDIAKITRELRQIFSFLDTPKLKTLIAEQKPDVFVCTHAVPSSLIAEQKRRGNCDLPLAAIVTDYDVHSYWTHPNVDLYLVANEKSKKTLMHRGIAEEKIKVAGIPVNPAFKKKVPAKEAKRKLGLDPSKPAVLVMGGARGLGPIEKIIYELLSLKPAPQILAVAGNNKDLEKEITRLRKPRQVRMFGFTNQISLLMDASDLLVTKPGGLTSSEALIKGLPMLIVNPIPGQEERNALYLKKQGAAVQISGVQDLKDKVKRLLANPAELKKISERMLAIAAPDAAETAAKEILKISPVKLFL